MERWQGVGMFSMALNGNERIFGQEKVVMAGFLSLIPAFGFPFTWPFNFWGCLCLEIQEFLQSRCLEDALLCVRWRPELG